MNECPILDIKVLDEASASEAGYEALTQTFGVQQYRLAYSKTVSANGLNQPIVGTNPVNNREQPCIGVNKETLWMDEDTHKRVFLPFENKVPVS